MRLTSSLERQSTKPKAPASSAFTRTVPEPSINCWLLSPSHLKGCPGRGVAATVADLRYRRAEFAPHRIAPTTVPRRAERSYYPLPQGARWARARRRLGRHRPPDQVRPAVPRRAEPGLTILSRKGRGGCELRGVAAGICPFPSRP